jgi:elongation factor G
MAARDVRNIAVVGHKGSGKTSLVEAMLYVARVTPRLGRVDQHNGALDDTPEERAHGATLEARVVQVPWNGTRINVLDTPGEASLLSETRLALAVADAAVLVISARDGVQSGTERVFEWIHEARLPCLVVVTKVDDEHARVEEVAAEARERVGQIALPGGREART